MSFFLNHLGHGQIAELLAQPHQLLDHGLELAQGLNLLAIERHDLWVAQAHGEGFAPLFASEQGIRAALGDGAVGVSDLEELIGKRPPAQLAQINQLLQEGLAS